MTAFDDIYDPTTHSFRLPEDIRGNALFQLFGLYLVAIQIVRKPDLLHGLKGSLSNVLSVIAMHIDKQTHATYTGVRRMVKESGYQSQAVVNALGKLEALGLIERVRVRRDRTLYVLRAPFAAVKENQAVDGFEKQNVSEIKAYHMMNDDSSRKPLQEKFTLQSSDDAFQKSKHAGGESKRGDENAQATAGKALTETGRLALPAPAPEIEPTPLPPEWAEVESALREAGIIASVASELVALLRERKREPAYAHGWVKVYCARREIGEVRSPGWLRTCLQKDDPVPDRLTIAEPELSELEKWKQELNHPYWGQFYSR